MGTIFLVIEVRVRWCTCLAVCEDCYTVTWLQVVLVTGTSHVTRVHDISMCASKCATPGG